MKQGRKKVLHQAVPPNMLLGVPRMARLQQTFLVILRQQDTAERPFYVDQQLVYNGII